MAMRDPDEKAAIFGDKHDWENRLTRRGTRTYAYNELGSLGHLRRFHSYEDEERVCARSAPTNPLPKLRPSPIPHSAEALR